MLILTIRTDKPEAEIGLFEGQKKLDYIVWMAHRELSVTLHRKIEELLSSKRVKLEELRGIVGFSGPGSFTGLRIGLSVANALAYGLNIPIVSAKGETWVEDGIKRLMKSENQKLALPEYGSPVHITVQRK